MQQVNSFIANTRFLHNPLAVLNTFLANEKRMEAAGQVDNMRFVGYVLELGYDTATIITSDPFKKAVGGIPRGSFLIMAPETIDDLPPHFTLLRVTETAPTPLSSQVQQTYFELHKKSMPELDIWTQSELQWGALRCTVLGMFYPSPDDTSKVDFAGDVNSILSAHRYKVFAPDADLLNVIVNGIVKPQDRFGLGVLRLTECRLQRLLGTTASVSAADIPVIISMSDFKAARTAMFGKTRLGKSNVVKLIAQGMLEATAADSSVGQLIFDINGEYANDNPQDGNRSIRSAYEDRCRVYALTERPGTPSHPLRLNFYEQPDSCLPVLASFLEADARNSDYIRSFTSVEMPAMGDISGMAPGDKTRAVRKIQMYWAILEEAGFRADETRLRGLKLRAGRNTHDFDPGFSQDLRDAVYANNAPQSPISLHGLAVELKKVAEFMAANKDSPLLVTGSGNPLFDANDRALLRFLVPSGSSSSGPIVLRRYIGYHSPAAGDFISQILEHLEHGLTVILDLGNATDQIRRYFADMLSREVFAHQEQKFVSNTLGAHYVQLYFEEAHNLFPVNDKELTGVYARFAKEGAKFHIGMVYSTQSPSTINKELLTQTENFFVGHLSSIEETKALSRLQVQFAGVEDEILRAKTPGYMRIITQSHRFVVPVYARKFEV